MANPEHLKIVKQGVEAWNRWREENPDVKPDLDGARLDEVCLDGARLVDASCVGTRLNSANLDHAILFSANRISATPN